MALSGLRESYLGADGKINWTKVNPDIERDWDKIHKGENGDYRMYYAQKALLSIFAKHSLPLSHLNERGVYHVLSRNYAKPIMEDWQKTRKFQAQWIANGKYPGIWCGVMHPMHARSASAENPVRFQVTFSAKYQMFDPENPNHIRMWKIWSDNKENRAKPNLWDTAKNIQTKAAKSMTEKMDNFSLPTHKCFFEENMFGACLLRQDYIAVVIVLEDSIASVDYLPEKYKKYREW